MFARLGPWCHDRRKLVLILWVAALFLINGLAGAAGSAFRDDLNLPDVESRDGFDLLDDSFGGQGTGYTGTIVFRAEQGVDDPEVQEQMQALFEQVAGLDDVARVDSPYEEGGEQLVSSEGPEAGLIAYANVELPEESDFTRAAEIRDIILEESPEIDGLTIELGGFIFADFEEPTAELLGLAFAIVILIVAFGSVLAMGLPIGVALFGIGLGSALTTLLSHVITIPEFAPFIGVMIGLGVGIDYALLIITRYREQLHAGQDVRTSISIAMDTAGRSVLFAGMTVVISLLGMLLMGVPFVQGLAVSASVTVALTVIASLTLLPALIGFAGERIELTRRRGLIAAGFVALGLIGAGLGFSPLLIGFPIAIGGAAGGHLGAVPEEGGAAPAAEAAAGDAGLPLEPDRPAPALEWRPDRHGDPALPGRSRCSGLRLGFSDESNFPDDTTTKQAYDLLVDGFGEGFNGPFLLVAEVGEGADLESLAAVTDAVAADPEVVFVSPPVPNDPENPTAVLWNVVPSSGPQEEATTELVNRLRDDVLPQAEEAIGTEVLVTGATPINVDFAEFLQGRLPYFFGAVLVLSFLLLMVVFRSLLVPLKAVIMNLLSIAAAYGVMVALFQWGWGGDITGVNPGARRALDADDAVRHRLRPVHGLRGVPAVPGPGGVATAPATATPRWPTAWPPPPRSSPRRRRSWSSSSAASCSSPTGRSS